ERARLQDELATIPGVQPFPSDANYILFRLDTSHDAGEVWQRLLDAGVLVRDFSRSAGLENCLRVSIGTEAENTRFLDALKQVVVR
ncbi:MAG: aminotransferase class I/II-fold pyridoxal phosphate-dependent enzyme, partial [Eggerthellaceae bacterium]|nr:aminotransferase class I/II-fold pyridoxal phosphate-dependent enzyme [Eggerthellaceae bacterium]